MSSTLYAITQIRTGHLLFFLNNCLIPKIPKSDSISCCTSCFKPRSTCFCQHTLTPKFILTFFEHLEQPLDTAWSCLVALYLNETNLVCYISEPSGLKIINHNIQLCFMGPVASFCNKKKINGLCPSLWGGCGRVEARLVGGARDQDLDYWILLRPRSCIWGCAVIPMHVVLWSRWQAGTACRQFIAMMLEGGTKRRDIRRVSTPGVPGKYLVSTRNPRSGNAVSPPVSIEAKLNQ